MTEQTAAPTGAPVAALQGIRVLDLSRVLAGPWAAQTLGDLGAEVIKIERPGSGDDTRTWGPPFLKDKEGNTTTDAAYYFCTNRNKRSVAVDMAKPAGQQLIVELAKQCDVLIENFKFGNLKQYGLDYDSLKVVNPRLIYCSVTGFGQTGPYAPRPGYDFLIQGMDGLMSVTGLPDGEPGGGPMKAGVAITDVLTGLFSSTAILAAIQARNITGRGQHIDMALLDVGVACMINQAMNYLYSGENPQRMGNAHPNTLPYQDFPTSDGYMIVAIGNDGQFARFCKATGKPWSDDPKFKTNAARIVNRTELIAMVRQLTVTKTTKEWVEFLEKAQVPCGPINTLADVFADPHVKARGMQISMTHPVGGEIPLVASPMRFSDTPVQYRTAPPPLGYHTREVLKDTLFLSDAQIDDLTTQGVLG
ncbi:CoA transferase [Comamonas serinivorans]|uniref:CoA transferase n=1 Tax=Comamonas serinivorans TaxID=1082851 RepID=A0A1Y0ENZ2_9BURK|nr:CaiB/BaiF CoA-transferase family protein [Comamonas serinivorans]ARU05343.1 CoA transferase [Comamonas serinivorans]